MILPGLKHLREAAWVRGRIGLGTKISLLFIATLLVLGAFNVFSVSRDHRRVMVDDYASKGYSIAISLANSSVETLLFHDASSVQSFIDNYRPISGVAYVYIASREGEILAHTFVPEFPPGLKGKNTVPEGEKSSTRNLEIGGVGRVLDVAVPILYGVIGEVHVGMDLNLVGGAVRRMVLNVVWQFGLALVIGIVVLYLAVRHLLGPVGRLARATAAIGRGDLRTEVSGGQDELGDLAGSFNGMARHLREFIGGISESRQDLEQATANLTGVAEDINHGVSTEQGSVRATETSMIEMQRLSEEIKSSVAVLSDQAARTGSSTGEILEEITSIADGSRSLFSSVENSGTSLSELASAIKEVTRNIDSLRDVAASSASSATQMDASIRSVEGQASEVARITGEVEEQFRTGLDSVNKTIGGMESIKASSARVTEHIRKLNTNMKAIGEILNLILDINDQTGLLALNAAIIAAQAGGRGYGFSVVAEEMKALSERTEKSAKEIAGMIRGLQEDARGTMSAVTEADARIEESFVLSRRAGEVILAVRKSVEEVNLRIQDIARATAEQTRMGSVVSAAARDLSLAIERLAGASTDQATSSACLLREAEEMRRVAEVVNGAVGGQTKQAREINERMQEMNAAIEEVGVATNLQLSAAREVMEAVGALASVSEGNSATAGRLTEVIKILQDRSEKLKRETEKFAI